MFLLELLFDLLFGGILQLTGAFVIWVLTGFTQPYQSILNINSYITGTIGFIAMVAIGVLFGYYK